MASGGRFRHKLGGTWKAVHSAAAAMPTTVEFYVKQRSTPTPSQLSSERGRVHVLTAKQARSKPTGIHN